MNFRKGDILTLKQAAINPDNYSVLFEEGTKVVISSIKGNHVNLLFPDGVLYAHDKVLIPNFFHNTESGKVLSKTISGTGTPPKALHAFLPSEANWKKNHIWSITINLEEREDKEVICPECTHDLPKDIEIDEIGRVKCPNCDMTIVPYDIREKEST